MEKNLSKIITNTMFECNSYACRCMKDIENMVPGEAPQTTLKLYSDIEEPLHFSYMPKEGLNLTGSAGGVIEHNILGKLLSIPADDIDKHIEFFEKYGFFHPLSFDEYASVDASVILSVSNHIRTTIRLMNALGKRDYKSMLIHASFLLFSNPVEYSTSESTYSTCPHTFTSLINNAPLFPDVNQNHEVQATGCISIFDHITNKKNPITIKCINAIRSGEGTDLEGSKSPWFKNIVALYLMDNDSDEDLRLIVDFFYHIFTENGVFDEVEYSKIKPYGKLNIDKLSAEMKDALVKISRILIAEEINYNIQGIHPKYNGKQLSATWQVGTLIEAIYFSVFYMKPGIEIYKECENPNCKRDKYFLVEATRTNKKYCCQQCANAAAAQRHRNRK